MHLRILKLCFCMFCDLYMCRNKLEDLFLNFCKWINKLILTLLVHCNVWKYSDLIVAVTSVTSLRGLFDAGVLGESLKYIELHQRNRKSGALSVLQSSSQFYMIVCQNMSSKIHFCCQWNTTTRVPGGQLVDYIWNINTGLCTVRLAWQFVEWMRRGSDTCVFAVFNTTKKETQCRHTNKKHRGQN